MILTASAYGSLSVARDAIRQLLELFDQHQVTARLVILSIKNRLVVGRDRQVDERILNLGNCAMLLSAKAEELNRKRFGVRNKVDSIAGYGQVAARNEIDAILNHAKGTTGNNPTSHLGFFAALYGYSPKSF